MANVTLTDAQYQKVEESLVKLSEAEPLKNGGYQDPKYKYQHAMGSMQAIAEEALNVLRIRSKLLEDLE